MGCFPWAALLRPRLLRLSHFVADSLFAETLKGTNPVRVWNPVKGFYLISFTLNRHKILWRYMQGGDIGFLMISMFATACCGATAIFFLIPLSSLHSSSSSICLPLLCHPFGVNCTNNLFCYNNTTPSGFVLQRTIGGGYTLVVFL